MGRYDKVCPICGKHFIVNHGVPNWLYKHRGVVYCSYNCWRTVTHEDDHIVKVRGVRINDKSSTKS